MEIVVAMAKNNVIGQNGDLPWHVPADLAHFKKLTTNHAILMGRRTWESIGRPLPDRLNIVVTRQKEYVADGAVVVHSIEDGLIAAGKQRVFIIGGAEIYKNALPKVTQLHVTKIDAELVGDTWFPKIDETLWVCTEKKNRPADEKNPYDLVFESWERKSK